MKSHMDVLLKDIDYCDLPDSIVQAVKILSSVLDFSGRLTQSAVGVFQGHRKLFL